MQKETAADLVAFLVVAREQSFTRAAAQLGVSQSALSQTMKGLEARLGVRLLTRTTRRVSPTEAGERLLRTIGPRFDEVDVELQAVTALRDTPAGTIRLTATENAAASVLVPALERFLPKYPDVKVEIVIEVGLTDIVAERLDAGVRFGERVAEGMNSVRIGPDARMAVVGAPSYFAARNPPKTPQDLTEHNCINLRLPTHGGLYVWEFEKAGRELNVRVDGQLCFWNIRPHPRRCACGSRLDLRHGGAGEQRSQKRPAGPCAQRLVRPFFRLPPLLPEPPPTDAGFRAAGRGATVSQPCKEGSKFLNYDEAPFV
jgi:DNA-binding transcriptional LysR family regulator